MTPKEFHDQLHVLFDKASRANMDYNVRMEMLGIAEYAVFTLKLALAEATKEANKAAGVTKDTPIEKIIGLDEPKEGDHFGA